LRGFRGVLEHGANNTSIALTKPIAESMHCAMDKLDQLIADKNAEIEALADKRRIALIELESLKRAALARPAGGAQAAEGRAVPATPKSKTASRRANGGGKKRGGRQAGDISHEWRKALALMHRFGERQSYSDIQGIAEMVGIKSQLPNVRERVRTMVENGLMKGDSDSGFSVTTAALNRFELDKIAQELQPNDQLPFNEIGPR
jgi:hypothetical protein